VSPGRGGFLAGDSARLTPYFLAYPGALGDERSPASQDSYGGAPEERADAQAKPTRPMSASQSTWMPASIEAPPEASDREDAVTIIFKDGRPPEQIHNYILTRDMLFVGDRHHPDIPVDQLDLSATAKANQDAGVYFHFPDISR
jgi:hypothetical protein